MNKTHLEKIKNDNGFIAALDQSGGSTPKALAAYGVTEDQFNNEEEMFELVHKMRTRIIKSPAFDAEHIIGAILFEHSMDSKINGKYTGEYFGDDKGTVQLIIVDRVLAEEGEGAKSTQSSTDVEDWLKRANEHNIFGTKMSSVIKGFNREAIKEVVEQQFVIGKQIIDAGLVPIIEPEVDIHSEDKSEMETVMKDDILNELNKLSEDQ